MDTEAGRLLLLDWGDLLYGYQSATPEPSPTSGIERLGRPEVKGFYGLR